MTHADPAAASPTTAAAETMATVGRSRGWRIAFAALTIVMGVIVLIWPGPTVLVLALIFGLQLLAGGVFWLVSAFAMDEASGSGRVLLALLGLLSILVGILCLRTPSVTVTVLALLIGATWVVGGVIEMFHGFGGGGVWAVLSGLLSLVIGVIVLAYPVSSAVAMSWLFGLMLVIYGGFALFGAFASSREGDRSRDMAAAGQVNPPGAAAAT